MIGVIPVLIFESLSNDCLVGWLAFSGLKIKQVLANYQRLTSIKM
jgi:hypothetical protein